MVKQALWDECQQNQSICGEQGSFKHRCWCKEANITNICNKTQPLKLFLLESHEFMHQKTMNLNLGVSEITYSREVDAQTTRGSITKRHCQQAWVQLFLPQCTNHIINFPVFLCGALTSLAKWRSCHHLNSYGHRRPEERSKPDTRASGCLPGWQRCRWETERRDQNLWPRWGSADINPDMTELMENRWYTHQTHARLVVQSKGGHSASFRGLDSVLFPFWHSKAQNTPAPLGHVSERPPQLCSVCKSTPAALNTTVLFPVSQHFIALFYFRVAGKAFFITEQLFCTLAH